MIGLSATAEKRSIRGEQDKKVQGQVLSQLVKIPSAPDFRGQDPGKTLPVLLQQDAII